MLLRSGLGELNRCTYATAVHCTSNRIARHALCYLKCLVVDTVEQLSQPSSAKYCANFPFSFSVLPLSLYSIASYRISFRVPQNIPHLFYEPSTTKRQHDDHLLVRQFVYDTHIRPLWSRLALSRGEAVTAAQSANKDRRSESIFKQLT